MGIKKNPTPEKVETKNIKKIDIFGHLSLRDRWSIPTLQQIKTPVKSPSSVVSKIVKRISKKTRSVSPNDSITIASYAAQVVLDKSKNFVGKEYKMKKILQQGRFCSTEGIKNKIRRIKLEVSFEKPADYNVDCKRTYKFPKRQRLKYAQPSRPTDDCQLCRTVKERRVSDSAKESQPPSRSRKKNNYKENRLFEYIDLTLAPDKEEAEKNRSVVKAFNQTKTKGEKITRTDRKILDYRLDNVPKRRSPGTTNSNNIYNGGLSRKKNIEKKH